ncbi:MipA/OmpV family protein [Halobacteriovorax sp. DPLXC-1]|uniref:MipA/OmpV family protein n=1 Tax=Halobacteriovorax sp. DPLXC-1 TaxID=3110771 RepID=UPI002FF032E5
MKYLIFLILFISQSVHAKWVTGIGYFQPGEYRVENEVSPMPFGLNIVPMIGYFSPRLRVAGPSVSARVLGNHLAEMRLKVNMIGDRYKAHEVELRKSAVDVGAMVRLFFLSASYAADISNTYKGTHYNFKFSWRFPITKNYFIVPSYTYGVFSSDYTNYYYGVRDSEVGYFSAYKVDEAIIQTITLVNTYILDKHNSLVLNFSYRLFDDEIYNSPTVEKKSYTRGSFFWNYTF